MADTHTIGSKVWVSDPKRGWIKGDVLKIERGKVVVETEDGEVSSYGPPEIPLQNPGSRGGVEDMTTLSYLNEPGVLWNLKCRYELDAIYTYTGSILIAVNPFTSLPHLYGGHMREQYCGRNLGELSPHVYAIADAAYRQMRKEMKSQSILVSGESGAGKTETSKLLMQYLTWMGNGCMEGGSGVEQQVLESNPLLEAFGNAKTSRNDNSSRFGKFVELHFDKTGRISGAAVRTYLLERSRVVQVTSPERNYHIFYQLCDGATPEEKSLWRLRPATEYRYLNQSSCFELPGVNNALEYQRTRRAMTLVGIPKDQQDAIFRIVAAVLQLGNITFSVGAEEDSSQLSDALARKYLAATAYLLGADEEGLNRALTTRTRITHDGIIVSPISVSAAEDNRDSLAKTLYSRLFDWLVDKINTSIGQDPDAPTLVGVLDIYGFEQFQINDFEQMCINLANEKLQQHFNHHVFKMEQSEYEKEEIKWSYIEFVDNQDVLDLIEKRHLGIFDTLDEQCRFPRATSTDFANKLYGTKEIAQSKRFSKPKMSQTAFTIDHYAGKVTYNTDNFLVKNRDFVVAEHQALLSSSSDAFVRTMFRLDSDDDKDKGGKPGKGAGSAYKFSSVAGRFKKQLGELMEALQKMEPHYIRCIKPNSFNRPMDFENLNVLHQLRCGGVLEAVRISCAGYPTKLFYEDFVDHFWNLVPELLSSELDDRGLAEAILAKAGLKGWQAGKTKIFLRAGQMAELDKMRTDLMHVAALRIQSLVRGFLARRQYQRSRKAVVTIQAHARGMLARAEARRLRRLQAAIQVQAAVRMWRARSAYRRLRAAVVTLQAAYRGRISRVTTRQLKEERAALTIQRLWRGHRARALFQGRRRQVIRLQCLWRCKLARRELRKRRMAARESGKLLKDKEALERRVGEIQGVLEMVQNQRNDLRQQLREERSSREAAEAQLAAVREELAAARAEAAASTEAAVAGEAEKRRAVEAEAAAAKKAAERAAAEAEGMRSKLQAEIIQFQQRVAVYEKQRMDIEAKAQAVKEDLMTRLNNAVKQRNAAREEALLTLEKLKKSEDELEARRLQPVAPAPAASSPGPIAFPVPLPVQQEGMLERAQKYLRQQIPTTPPRGAEAANGAAEPPEPHHAASAPLPLALPSASGRSPPYPALIPGQRLGSEGYGAGPPAGGAGDGLEVLSEVDRKQRELYAKQQQLLREQRSADQDKLLQAITENLGFHHGQPLAAIIIFRSCLQWKTFQADRTTLFDRIINTMGTQIERQQDNNACLSYWLSNTVTLLYLLQKNIKPASGGSYNTRLRTPATSRSFFGNKGSFTSFFSRSGPSAAALGEASIHGGGAGGFRQVEAKYPALLFKQQLDAFVQKIFPMLRDNVKKEITPQLAACIHAPRAATSRTRRGGAAGGEGGLQSQVSGIAVAQLSPHWGNILAVLEGLVGTLKANHVPSFLVQKLFQQLFSFINVQLFNQLLLRRECCSFSNGEYVKTGLAEVENWIHSAGKAWVGESWDELRYIRQAVTFLVIHQKHKKSLEEITNDLCPVLSVQQLYRISTMYWDDRYNTETVSHDVLGKMKQLMVDNNTAASHSFLLDDDSSIPFSLDDIQNLMEEKDMYQEVPVPRSLSEGKSFDFLRRDLRLASGPMGG